MQIVKKITVFLLLSISTFIMTSCGEEVPEEKSDYIGVWQGDNIFLEINANGDVSYAKVTEEGGIEETIDSPIQGFDGDDFSIGYLFFTKDFKVEKPPFKEDGMWKMRVNGANLVKVEE